MRSKNQGECYIEISQNGRIQKMRCSVEKADRILRSGRFDIVVDEVTNELRVQGKPVKELDDLERRQRAMLWLLFTGDKRFRITHAAIDRYMGNSEGSVQNLNARSGRATQAALSFKRLVGVPVYDKILKKGRNRTYPVRRGGWSHAWRILAGDPRTSSLSPHLQSGDE